MKKILLIDNDVRYAAIMIKVLKPHDYTITHAVNAAIGLWMAKQSRFDLVLMDMNLPDIQGPAVAACLRTTGLNQHLSVIAVTADIRKKTQRDAIASGCQEVIYKPINVRTFPDQIARYLQVQNS